MLEKDALVKKENVPKSASKAFICSRLRGQHVVHFSLEVVTRCQQHQTKIMAPGKKLCSASMRNVLS